MYHPTIQKLDQAASEFHAMGMQSLCNGSFLLAGQLQQELLRRSPYKGRRFLHAQWVWALGHIGLLYQLIRWFKLKEPQTRLVLTTINSANDHFLNALAPHFSFLMNEKEPVTQHEAMCNAVYFGCPDGIHSLVNFYKVIERECSGINLLELSSTQFLEAELVLDALKVKRPFVALQARKLDNDSARNVTVEQIDEALEEFLAKGYSVISTGLDQHPINAKFPSVLELPDPLKASFLLSASCDQFIGSNSGAWTIAHAYRRPVQIMNDYGQSAWIYP